MPRKTNTAKPKQVARKLRKRVTRVKKASSADGQASRPQEEIRLTAYQIWEEKGRPGNGAIKDWLQAEKTVKAKS